MKKLTPYLIPLSLLVIAISIFSLGYESKMGSEQMMGATTKIKLTDPNSVTPAATSTPTAGMIPIASSSGYIENWTKDYIQATSNTTYIINATTSRTISSESNYLVKKIKVPYDGYYIISYKCSTSGATSYCSINRNGTPLLATTFDNTTLTITTSTILFAGKDDVEIYCYNQNNSYQGTISDFTVSYGLIQTTTPVFTGRVITD